MKLRLAAGAAILGLTCFAAPAAADEPAPTPGPAAPTESAAAAATPTPGPAAATTDAAPVASKRTVWPWVLMGTGVALVVTALVLEVSAVRESDKGVAAEVKLLSDLPEPEKQRLLSEKEDHESSASSERTAALIIGTAGFLTVAGSVVLWFYEGSKTAPAAAPAPAPAPAARFTPSFRPSLGPSYAGAVLGASF